MKTDIILFVFSFCCALDSFICTSGFAAKIEETMNGPWPNPKDLGIMKKMSALVDVQVPPIGSGYQNEVNDLRNSSFSAQHRNLKARCQLSGEQVWTIYVSW